MQMYQLNSLINVLNKVKNSKLPIKTAYHIALLLQETAKHIEFYQQQLSSLLIEYGKKDAFGELIPTEDGQGVLLAEETMDEAYQKLAELRELDVELPDYKFDLDAFGDIEISPQEMLILMPFIEA